MNQFFYTLSFCLKHFSYLFVLALPLITLEFAVSYLVLQLDLNENMSNDLIIESIQPVAIQLANCIATGWMDSIIKSLDIFSLRSNCKTK